MKLQSPFFWLARTLGAAHVPRATAVAVVALLGMAGGISALVVSDTDWVPQADEPARVQSAQALDRDGDGLPDAIENRIGSDLENATTLGGDVLDGWLYTWFGESIDWDDPSLLDDPSLVPPSGSLPEPLRYPGMVTYPTVAELYALDREWRDPEGEVRLWWLEHDAMDPLEWDNRGDGIADAWLLQHGLDPLAVDVDGPAPGDASMTVREKYVAGLDPSSEDTEGDGLPDHAEISGVARFGDLEVRFDPTDPTRFSTRGDGVADGYVVRFGLDPHDDAVADATPAGDGVTVREAYEVTHAHCLATQSDGDSSGSAACDWLARLREGPVVDPTTWDSLGDGVPDAWAMRDPHGIAHPLEDSTKVVAYDTSEWDGTPWGGDPEDLFGVVIDEQNPEPEDPSVLTVHDLYTYQRPASWDEATDGPWWDGLPTVIDSPPGALPPAVALRGWTVEVDVGLGRGPEQDADPESLVLVHVTADPRKADTDSDGLTDMEEYFGVARQESHAFRTDPGDPDTAGSGLTDCQEILHIDRIECEDPEFTGPHERICSTADGGGFCLDPLRRDTSGSFLTDGNEYDYWTAEAGHYAAWLLSGAAPNGKDYSRHAAQGLSAADLGPLGDVDGDGIPNILDRDSDADDLPDGWELFPNRFHPEAIGILRPATDPALIDSDGDELPDPWEVEWSRERFHGCGPPCSLPDDSELKESGWPLDPSQASSLTFGSGPDKPDRDLNYANDRISVQGGSAIEFSNGLGYMYDLNPYERQTDRSDGIRDMFAIHWGVRQVPAYVQPLVDVDEQLPTDQQALQWTRAQAANVTGRFAERAGIIGGSFSLDDEQEHVSDLVVIDPRQANPHVTGSTNLLELFTNRAKGAWAYVPLADVTVQDIECASASGDHRLRLPSDGARAELVGPGYPADTGFPLRVSDGEDLASDDPKDARFDLTGTGACWEWIEYPLEVDMERGTNPWLHDTSGNGLPDAWEHHYGVSHAGNTPNLEMQSSIDQDCKIIPIENGRCLTYADAYIHGLDPRDEAHGDTDGGGVADWIELALGLDPLDRRDDHGEEDWSGNGIPNLIELTFGLNPFSPDTSASGLLNGGDLRILDEDEGLRNFLEAERGVDDVMDIFPFLAATNGDGNLCLRHGTDPVPHMENRPNVTEPAPGPLNRTQLLEWYVDLGILHEWDHGGSCPDPFVNQTTGEEHPYALFKRESIFNLNTGFWGGAGSGGPADTNRLSDSLRRDTSSDGVPDGWLVYWRDQAGRHQEELSPATDTTRQTFSDPDGDFVPTGLEYGGPDVPLGAPFGVPQSWFAPPDWDERHDGTWWGGTDPSEIDTSGNQEWFLDNRHDLVDRDLDNDGIPDRYDPFPSIDHDNVGIIQWNEPCPRLLADPDRAGCYVTDYPLLWEALVERPESHLQDEDSDLVPNFLDRVRVQIADVEFDQGGELEKDGDSTKVAGVVRVDEQPDGEGGYDDRTDGSDAAEHGAAVANVTVKAFLRDQAGSEALVGANFSDETGAFVIPVRVADHVVVSCMTGNGSVDGSLCQDQPELVLPSDSLRLAPGPLTLRLEVEANDPRLQPLRFHETEGSDSLAVAYKSTPFVIRDGAEPKGTYRAGAVALTADGDGPSTSLTRVKHTVNSTVFPHSTSILGGEAGAFLLQADTALRFTQAPFEVMLGDALEVEGLFVDIADDVPLVGYNVTVTVAQDGQERVETQSTNTSGLFRVSFPTGNAPGELQPGSVTVSATVDVTDVPELREPDGTPSEVVSIRRDSAWADVVLNGQSIDTSGIEFPHDATDVLALQARLVDHRGENVTNTPVALRVVGLPGMDMDGPIIDVEGETDDDGFVVFPAQVLEGELPLGQFRLELEEPAPPGGGANQDFAFLLNPLYDTRIVAPEDVHTDVGRPAVVEGILERIDGRPVFDPDANFTLVSSSGEVAGHERSEGTNSTGHFRIQVRDEGLPVHHEWTISYAPGHAQLRSAVAAVNTSHSTTTRIATEEVRVLRDAPVPVPGQLLRPDGSGVGDAVVEARWADDDGAFVSALTDGSGNFTVVLPARDVAQHDAVLRFDGTLTAHPSSQTATVAIVEPTLLRLGGQNFTIHDDNTTFPDRFVTGNLTDGTGQPLPSRQIDVMLQGPGQRVHATQRFTNPQGEFHVTMEHVEPLAPGEWNVTAVYDAGSTLEASSLNHSVLHATHAVRIDLTRVPAEARSGQELVVRGTLGATPGGFLADVPIDLHLDGSRVANTTATPGHAWQVRFDMPAGTLGGLTLRATGTAPDAHVQLVGDEENITRVRGVDVQVEQQALAGDSNVHLRAHESGTGNPVSGLTLVVLRSVDGEARQTYNVTTDANGNAVLQLRADQTGDVRVVAVSHPTYRLQAHDSVMLTVAPATPDGVGRGWIIAGAVSAVLAMGLVVAFVVWRRRQRGALAAAFEEAHRLLIDSRMSPSEVIQAVYTKMLRVLEEAGDEIKETHTVRDIAQRATQAFRLPRGPMDELTLLFELAKYSEVELSPPDRNTAIRALRRLSTALGTHIEVRPSNPERSEQGGAVS